MDADNIDQNEEQNKVKLEKQENRDRSTDTNTNEPQKISVELNKYKTLIEALGNRGKVRRVVITIFFLGILLFVGISAITVAIKRLYPYSDITTNGLGATTIKSEKNEVSYWLFNTAILWANSGIHVDEGDIITIRASGKSHTAIHHLYDAASNNYEISDSNKNGSHEWVGSEGIPEKETGRGKYRRRFRIFPNMPSEALLMQVANGNPKDTPQDEGANPENFYFIGKERQHIYINEGGDLYFAVNDIVLNRSTIAKMMWESIREKYNDGDSVTRNRINNLKTKYEILDKIDYNSSLQFDMLKRKGKTKKGNIEEDQKLCDTIKNLFEEVFSTKIQEANYKNKTIILYEDSIPKTSFTNTANTMWSHIQQELANDSSFKKFIIKLLETDSTFFRGDSIFLKRVDSVIFKDKNQTNRPFITSKDPIGWIDKTKFLYDSIFKTESNNIIPKIGKMELGYSREKDNTLVCELSYYYGKNSTENAKRKKVWFEDNIGSFLIVIEKTK